MFKFCSKICYFLVLTAAILAQDISINKIEPPNWWEGMKLNTIQLMVYGKNLKNIKATFNSDNIKVKDIHEVLNTDYLFIDADISPKCAPGEYILTLSTINSKCEYKYQIRKRENSAKIHQGFSNEDVVYLIMPDRFANGDISNDTVKGYNDAVDFERSWNNNKSIGRHGGDIQGIIDHLDYLKELGVTALWITPVVENNTFISYHGYVATDYYKVDKRLGSNQLYKELIDKAHQKGLKIIFDHVANHFGIEHPWIKDMPVPDWLNGTPEKHLPAFHNKEAFSDIHADSSSILKVTQGWFADNMPDINQRNPYVQKYIIQNTIWWTEFSGLDGIREDTYPYNDQKFMSDWAKTILDEYPTLNIVAEVWTGDFAYLSSFQKNSFYKKAFDSNIPSLTDFGLRDTFWKYCSGNGSLYDIYEAFARDFIYPNPEKMMIFVDNHDVARIKFYAKNDMKLFNALQIMLTSRGIPQLLYGTEIGIKGEEEHGLLRADFPGGFSNSSHNAFTKQGRTKDESKYYNFISKILELRKEHPALSKGKMVHYPPVNDIYAYFKIYENEKILNIIKDGSQKEVNLNNYADNLEGVKAYKDLVTGNEYKMPDNKIIKLPGDGPYIFLLK